VREIAGLVKIRGRDDPKANIFQLVRDWLRGTKSGRWILVLDNVDDTAFLLEPGGSNRGAQGRSNGSDALFGYLPVCDQGSILITTRSEDAARKLVEHSDMIRVGAMKDEDALRLLEKKLGDRVDIEDAPDLARELENMPLALTQAAAYLMQMGGRCSVRKYLDKLRKSDKSKTSILDEDAGDLRRDLESRNSIFLTWQISFEHVHKTRPSAAELLSLMSFCDRQAIPEELVRRRNGNEDAGAQERSREHDKDDVGESSSDSADSEEDVFVVDDGREYLDDAFDKDVRVLQGYSFVSLTTDPSVFEMHRLVQVATRKWLKSHGQLEQWKEQYIDNLCALFPPGTYENWSRCQIYYPHAQSAAELKPKEREALKWATIMYNAAWYAWTRVGADDAEKMAVASLKVRVKTLGEYDEYTLSSQGMLALAKQSKGRWDEAEELEVQVMETTKKVLGAEHPDTLTSMGNLASTYWNQGRWKEAEELQVQVMETTKKVVGAEHPDTLRSMGNLALTYSNQGRWDETEELEVQVMETRKKVIGAEHPDTLTSMGNLASTYRNQGRWKEAEELEVQVMETTKKARRNRVGKRTHPDRATPLPFRFRTLCGVDLI
jgi:tetratricopeptide (TPR) repeat protein